MQSLRKEARCYMKTKEEKAIKEIQRAIGLIGFESFKKKAHQKIDSGSESITQKEKEHKIVDELLECVVKIEKIETLQAKNSALEEIIEELEAEIKQSDDTETTIKKQEELTDAKALMTINKEQAERLEKDLEVAN